MWWNYSYPIVLNRKEETAFEFDDVKLRGELKIAKGGKCLKRVVNLPFLRTDENNY